MSFLNRLMSLSYRAIHAAVPGLVLNGIAKVLPYKNDSYAPGGFFVEPPKHIPPELPGKPPKMPAQELNWLVLACYVEIVGVVTRVEIRPPNADWQHETFHLKPDDPGVLNSYNANVYGDMWGVLECEGPVGSPLPKLDQRVAARGQYTINLANGFVELHWCTSWRAL